MNPWRPLSDQARAHLRGVPASSSELPPEAIHVALGRILSSKTFANCARYRDFVQFTVGETLAGRGSTLKEYVLGVEVFNQEQSFDPHISPLVRVAASRLRTRLRSYYNGEGSRDPILIDFPKGSYVPVFRPRRQEEAQDAAGPAVFWPWQKWKWIGVSLLGLLALLGLSRVFQAHRSNQPSTDVLIPQIQVYRGVGAVAVLPFVNGNTTPETEDFNDWLAQELVNVSNKVGSLHAVAADSVPSQDGTAASIQAIGKKLGVDAELQGSVRGRERRLQVSVQLVAVKNGYHLWSNIYDCQPADIVLTQHMIARAVVNALRSSSTVLAQKPETVSLEAYNLYLDGLFQMKQGGDKRLLYARKFFERAIATDPAFSPPYSRLAAAYVRFIKWDIVPVDDTLAPAQAEQALEFREHFADAHGLLAVVDCLRWRWEAARQDFAIAIKGDPSSADLREAYAVVYLLPMGRLDEALEQIGKAESLDPQSPGIWVSKALVHYYRHDYDGALGECQKALAVQPDLTNASFGLASVLAHQGRFLEAIEEIASLKASADDLATVSFSGYLAGRSGATRDARAALGHLDEISKRKPVPSYYRSLIYLGMRDSDQAIRWLERAYEEHDPSLIYLAVNPKWGSLRSHPGFLALLRKIGLPPGLSRSFEKRGPS